MLKKALSRKHNYQKSKRRLHDQIGSSGYASVSFRVFDAILLKQDFHEIAHLILSLLAHHNPFPGNKKKRLTGVGPAYLAWEASVLPMYYSRIMHIFYAEYQNFSITI